MTAAMRSVGRDRPEQSGLITQHGKVSDGLTAVGRHDSEIDGDPARVMAAPTLPQTGKGVVGDLAEGYRNRQVTDNAAAAAAASLRERTATGPPTAPHVTWGLGVAPRLAKGGAGGTRTRDRGIMSPLL